MKKINFILSIILFVTLLGCKTVTTKVDKTISEYKKMINKYMEQGQIEQATDVANKNQQMVENLINLPK